MSATLELPQGTKHGVSFRTLLHQASILDCPLEELCEFPELSCQGCIQPGNTCNCRQYNFAIEPNPFYALHDGQAAPSLDDIEKYDPEGLYDLCRYKADH